MVEHNNHIINPDTGWVIHIGGATFQQLIFNDYDFINGELVWRTITPSPATRYYYYNTETGQLILAGSRRYQELMNNGWDIENDYYLIPPWVVSNNNYNMQEGLPIYNYNIQEGPNYNNIIIRYQERLDKTNISLCREWLIPIEKEEGEYCTDCKLH